MELPGLPRDRRRVGACGRSRSPVGSPKSTAWSWAWSFDGSPAVVSWAPVPELAVTGVDGLSGGVPARGGWPRAHPRRDGPPGWPRSARPRRERTAPPATLGDGAPHRRHAPRLVILRSSHGRGRRSKPTLAEVRPPTFLSAGNHKPVKVRNPAPGRGQESRHPPFAGPANPPARRVVANHPVVRTRCL